MKLNRAAFTTPEGYSLLTLSPTGCVLSALKKAEDRESLILRLFNPSETTSCDVTLSMNRPIAACNETDLKECLREGEGNADGITGAFRPGQSRTFDLSLA